MPPFSRRALLEGAVASLGLTLLGCSQETDNQPPQAKIDGAKLVLSGVEPPSAGAALPFLLPGGEPALLISYQGQLLALSAVCTHSGCTVEWKGTPAQPLVCPCHLSVFLADGSVSRGPAGSPLKRFSARIEGKNVVLAAT